MTDPNMDNEPSDLYEDDLDTDAPTVSLSDDEGRSLLCYVERSLEIDDGEYLLLLPVDTPIEIFAWELDESGDDEILVDIEEEEIEEIFSTARAVLAELDLTLNRTALTLTVSGDIPEADDEEIITLDIGEPDSESEEFQLLANFYHEEQEYAIYTPLDPLLLFARVTPQGEPELLSPEEFQAIRMQLEDQIFDDLT
jgi:hypothetical protein